MTKLPFPYIGKNDLGRLGESVRSTEPGSYGSLSQYLKAVSPRADTKSELEVYFSGHGINSPERAKEIIDSRLSISGNGSGNNPEIPGGYLVLLREVGMHGVFFSNNKSRIAEILGDLVRISGGAECVASYSVPEVQKKLGLVRGEKTGKRQYTDIGEGEPAVPLLNLVQRYGLSELQINNILNRNRKLCKMIGFAVNGSETRFRQRVVPQRLAKTFVDAVQKTPDYRTLRKKPDVKKRFGS